MQVEVDSGTSLCGALTFVIGPAEHGSARGLLIRIGTLLQGWFVRHRSSALAIIPIAMALVVFGLFGTASLSTPAGATGPSWNSPVVVAPGIVSAVSCSSSSFCAAVDGNGYVVTYNGTGWSSPDQIDPNGSLTAVSCPTSAFCMAVDNAGNFMTFNGTTWSNPEGLLMAPGTGATSVSCFSNTFCMVLTNTGGALAYNGTSWGPTTFEIPDSQVSCWSATSCTAIGNETVPGQTYQAGYVSVYDGAAGWSGISPSAQVFNDGSDGFSISCSSSSLCAVLDQNGYQSVFNGTGWSTPAYDQSIGGQWASVSCAPGSSPVLCVAVNAFDYSTWNGVSWSSPAPILPVDQGQAEFDSVSCPTAIFCMAVSVQDLAESFNGSSWGVSTSLEIPSGYLTSVSCATSAFCVAVGNYGYALTYSATSWSAPQLVDTLPGLESGFNLSSVSCPTIGFCVAVDTNGDDVTYNGLSWSTSQSIDPEPLNSVSCASATLCVAGDFGGSVLVDSNGTWGAPDPIDAGSPLSVSCATGTSTVLCAAVSDNGEAFFYNGTNWGPAMTVLSGDDLSSVSCYAMPLDSDIPYSCWTVDASGNAFNYNGADWVELSGVAPDARSVSCASVTFCAVVGVDAELYGANGWGAPSHLDLVLTSVSCPTSGFCVAVDGAGHAVTYGTSIVPTPLTITTTSLPSGTVGRSYSATLAAVGGAAPYSWSVLSGTLPGGLSLDSTTGVISGTLQTAGTSELTIEVTDSTTPTPETATSSLSIVSTQSIVSSNMMTVTRISATPDPLLFPGSVTYSATVNDEPPFASTNPPGSVTFTQDGAPISSCTAVPMSNVGDNGGVADCTLSLNQVGQYAIAATYSGARGFDGSSGTAVETALWPTPLSSIAGTMVSSADPPGTTVSNAIWSGYVAKLPSASASSYQVISATYIEPNPTKKQKSSCSPSGAAGLWVGLGGVGKEPGAFVQAGTSIGNFTKPLNPNQAWIEADSSQNFVSVPIKATPGQKFGVLIAHDDANPYSYFFEFHNFYTGQWIEGSYTLQALTLSGNVPETVGGTAESIVERAGHGANLEDFGTTTFDVAIYDGAGTTTALTTYPNTSDPDYGPAQMLSASGHQLTSVGLLKELDTTSPAFASDRFDVTWESCH